MAEDNKRKLIAAKCPKCGQVVKFYMPEQGCVVKLKCPQQQCGHVFGVKITQKEIHLGNGATQQQQGESHPVTDPIVNTGGTPSGVIARLLQKRSISTTRISFMSCIWVPTPLVCSTRSRLPTL